MAQDYTEFRTLLRRAIATRTQAQFANDAGISAEHLNRLLNSANMHRPTRTTLQKIANAARNGVMLQDLEQALDMTADDEKEPDFETRANNVMKAFVQIVKEAMLPTVARDIPTAVENILGEVRNRVSNALPVSYLVKAIKPYPGGLPHSYADNYATVDLTMADDSNTARARIIIYFDYIHNSESVEMCLLHRIGSQPHDAGLIYGFPEKICDSIGENDDPEKIGQLLNKDYYLEFTPVSRFREPYIQEDSKDAKQRIIDAIFGNEISYPQTIIGLGFWLDGIPKNLKAFVKENLKAILEETGVELNKEDTYRTELKHALESNDTTSEDIAGIMAEYQAMYGLGWGGAITAAMFKATGFDFQYIQHSDGQYMTDKDCVVLDTSREDVQREAVLTVLAHYVTQLGIDSFGDIVMTYMAHDYVKSRKYKIKEEKNTATCSLKDMLDNAQYVKSPNDGHPDVSGIYNCLLKDGRHAPLLYLRPLGKWHMNYVDWTPWIDKYDPSPEETYPDIDCEKSVDKPVEQA